MASGARNAGRIVGLVMALAGLGWSPCDASTELTYARQCRKAINVQGRTYALKRMGLVMGCADKLLKCELVAESGPSDVASCRASVAASCSRRIGAGPETGLGKIAARFEAKVGVACQTPFFDYTDVVSTGPGGLWFANDPTCGASIDLPTFMACLRDQLDARLDELVSAHKPRAAVLFDNVGLGSALPHLVRPPLVDAVVAATGAGSGELLDLGALVVPTGSGLRVSGDAATLPCGGSTTDGHVTITIGGTATQRFTLNEPYDPSGSVIAGPWIGPASIPFTIELADGACQHTIGGTVTVP